MTVVVGGGGLGAKVNAGAVAVVIMRLQNVLVRFKTKTETKKVVFFSLVAFVKVLVWAKWMGGVRMCLCILVSKWLKWGLPTASRGFGSPVRLSRAPTLKKPAEWPMASQVPPSRPGSRSIPAIKIKKYCTSYSI